MKVGGQILWNVTPFCETWQICSLMSRRPMNDVPGNHVKDQSCLSFHWPSITLHVRITRQVSINLERKSDLDCSSDTPCTRGVSQRVTYFLQTLRCWRRWTHRIICAKRLSVKEVIFHQESCEFSPIRRCTNQTSWRRSRPENIHFGAKTPNSRTKSPWFFLENQMGLVDRVTTHFRMLVKR